MTNERIEKVIKITYVHDASGHWWSEAANPEEWHGPFRTHAEAEADAIKVAIGPNAEIEKISVLHDAPEAKQ